MVKFDPTINLTTIGGLLASIIAAGVWIGHVENKIDALGGLVVSTAQMDKRLGNLEQMVTANRGILLDVQKRAAE